VDAFDEAGRRAIALDGEVVGTSRFVRVQMFRILQRRQLSARAVKPDGASAGLPATGVTFIGRNAMDRPVPLMSPPCASSQRADHGKKLGG
jgi:hypothetical protein